MMLGAGTQTEPCTLNINIVLKSTTAFLFYSPILSSFITYEITVETSNLCIQEFGVFQIHSKLYFMNLRHFFGDFLGLKRKTDFLGRF